MSSSNAPRPKLSSAEWLRLCQVVRETPPAFKGETYLERLVRVSSGWPWFAQQIEIADNLGCSVSTVYRARNSLIAMSVGYRLGDPKRKVKYG